MNESDRDWPAVEAALERYFLARERGEAIDVKAACDGDVELAAKVLEVLGEAPDMVVESAEPAPEQPTSFGDFDVVEQIGKGGMGTVYLALQRSLGREVALKVLDSGPKVMPSARVRMRREAELTALLDHPNIVPVYAVGEVGEVPFIAMKYLVGPTLADVESPWPARKVAEVGKALAEALDAAHLQGVVHRDVKPANVIMDGDNPVFVDFGLARAQSDPTLTQEGKVAGTLRYMAPERLDARSVALDPRVDIYGLGATLYELIAGHEVFGDQSPTALVRSVLVRDPAPLRLRGAEHDLETIIMRALAKEPGRRFGNASELAQDLGRFLVGEPVASRRVSIFERGWRQMRRYPRASALIGAALLLVAVSLTFFLVQRSSLLADRAARVADVQGLMQRGVHVGARDELLRLSRRHPGDSEIAQLLDEAEAQVAIDRLMVLATDNVDSVGLEDVEVLVEAGRAASGKRSELLQLGALVALGIRGDRGLAGDRLAALPSAVRESREGRAVCCWLEERPLPWELPSASPDRSPDLSTLTTMVRRLAGDEPDALLSELAACSSEVARSQRHVFVEAIVMMDLGRFDVAAASLQGLATEDAWPAIWRGLAQAQLEMGQLDRAGNSLRMIGDDRSSNFEYTFLRHRLLAAGVFESLESARELAVELRREERGTPAATLVLAELEAMVDAKAVPRALEQLQQLERTARNRLDRDRLVALQMKLDGWHLSSEFGGEEPIAQHRAFVERWRERAAQLGNSVTREKAGLWLARSLVRTGEVEDLAAGLDLFARISTERASDPEVAIEFALTITSLPTQEHGAILRAYTFAARVALEKAAARARERQSRISPGMEQELGYYTFLVNWKLQDCVAIVATYPRARDLLPEAFRAAARQNFETSQDLLDAFRGR